MTTFVEEVVGKHRAPEEPVPLSRNRHYLLLWAGAGSSNLGSHVSTIAYTLLVYWATRSEIAASMVTFAALLPHLLVQLPAGVLVDRWDRRRVMIFCDVGRIIAIGSVVVAVFLGHVWLPQLMVVAFVEASLTVFYLLAERAAVINIVPDEQIGGAMAANEGRSEAAGLIGQPIGTFLFAVTRWVPFGFTMLAHLGSLITLLFIKRELRAERRGEPAHLLAEMAEGFRWVWSQLYLRRALGLIAISNLLFQVLGLGLIVIVVQNGGSPATIGYILAASGVGGLLGALTSNFYMDRWGIRKIIITVNISWMVLMPMIGFFQTPIALGAIFAALLYGAGVSNVAGIVYTMKTAPGDMQGRVGSIATLLASGANSLGALMAGFVLAKYGTTAVMVGVGAVMVVVAVLAVLGFAGRKAAEAERIAMADDDDDD